MRVSQRASARRRAAPLLACLALCAVGVVRQWVTQSGQPAEGPLALESAPPPARLDAARGPAAQGRFTLLGIARAHDLIFLPPAPIVVVPPAAVTTLDGTGLWVRVAGGLGVRALPNLPQPQELSFGRFRLTTSGLRVAPDAEGTGVFGQWQRADGTILSPETVPYRMYLARERRFLSSDNRHTLLIFPVGVERRFVVTARPLGRRTQPLGPPVSLAWQPVGDDALFVQIPSGYGRDTEAFEVTIARRDEPGRAAHWRIVNLPRMASEQAALPPAAKNGPIAATLGRLKITARAFEAPDRWSAGGVWTRDVPGQAPEMPVSLDGHGWSGLPTLRCRIEMRALAVPDGEQWELIVERGVPQWAAAHDLAGSERGFSPRGPTTAVLTLRPGARPLVQDMTCGVAYPGQQRYLQLRGALVHYQTRREPLIFHDADVQPAPTGAGRRLVWRAPQQQTTPSGVTVAVLNARAPFAGGPDEFFPDFIVDSRSREMRWPRPLRLGEGELRLAWSPRAVVRFPGANPQGPAPQVWGLEVGGNLRLTGGPLAARTWEGVWLPGAPPPLPPPPPFDAHRPYLPRRPNPLSPLVHGGFLPVGLRVASPGPAPLPAHLRDVTVTVLTRVEVERRPFVLTVPVGKAPLVREPERSAAGRDGGSARTARAGTRPGDRRARSVRQSPGGIPADAPAGRAEARRAASASI